MITFSDNLTHFKCSLYHIHHRNNLHSERLPHHEKNKISECHREWLLHKHARPLTRLVISITPPVGTVCWHRKQYFSQQKLDEMMWECNEENMVSLRLQWWALRSLQLNCTFRGMSCPNTWFLLFQPLLSPCVLPVLLLSEVIHVCLHVCQWDGESKWSSHALPVYLAQLYSRL